MRNGSNVLDHGDVETGGLKCTDGSFTALAGTLDVNFNGLQTIVLDCSLGSSFSSHLSSKGSGLLGTAEAQTAGGSPGQSVTVGIGTVTMVLLKEERI